MESRVPLCTIGYQGKHIGDVIAALIEASIDLVLDIRTRPISRKPGFSKQALTSLLEENGIAYRHLPELGMPIELLAHRTPKDGNAAILSAYRERLPGLIHGLDEVCSYASIHNVCLLCFEADPSQCHRGLVANRLREERQLQVRHL